LDVDVLTAGEVEDAVQAARLVDDEVVALRAAGEGN
jgi:hypothetical protein